ncbi:Uncharacterised protein family UPF0058 [Haladaptatus litoreus]|uniref:Uncharacterized protein family UPF0058 n=1 Tax=Haladaptatus litoreus TaxID=553468 RepID=A0A1N7D987_9EURY|nr:UPF0058 family protein [Haladaptatus litoreus]SIR72379.1 Uncharacterised protein family UPF0058 [Haladaptatus litoreus]
MKKQELIHLHGLLLEVRDQYEDWTGERVTLSDYEDKGVYPTSIHRSKTAHRDAVFLLSNGITGKIPNQMTELATNVE